MTGHRELAVAILAAGQGKRMGNPDLAKVLAPLCAKPLLGYVLEQANELNPSHVVVIIGHQRDAVRDYVTSVAPSATCVVQDQQLGTGHAVQQTEPVLANLDVDVIILSGDVPLLTASTLKELVTRHRRMRAVATVLTAKVPDPTGYGRIIRNADGNLTAIVEHKDATPSQLAIDEINSGVYIVHSTELFRALSRVKNSNAQGEYYLTDIINILQRNNFVVEAWCAPSWEELHGINTVADLERAGMIMEERSTV
ncbi:MAG: NTP transferase domain-containing protein [Candidatus Kapabacteria bacterium]|nr:NTP transferase domain-containing protein [Candidatus Kapabacteria bacterium]